MLSRCGSLILVLWLAGCSLDPVYISAPPDDGSFIWATAGSIPDGYEPVRVGPPESNEAAFVCRADIHNLGLHGFHTGELRDGRCLVPEYGEAWIFAAPHFQQLLSRAGAPYRWAPLSEFPRRPRILGPVYTNNKVQTEPIASAGGTAQTSWFPCAARSNGSWHAGKIEMGTADQLCWIVSDANIEQAVYDDVLVLYAPAR